MPPKKAAKGKEPAAAKEVILGEYDLSLYSLPELQGFVLRLQKEVEKVRDSRNFFEVERDKTEQYWESSKQELEVTDAKIKDLEKQIEDIARKFEEKLSFGDEEIKYFEFERERRLEEHKKKAEIRRAEASNTLQSEIDAKFKEFRKKTEELESNRKTFEETVERIKHQDKEFLLDSVEEKQDSLERTIRSFEEMYGVIDAQLNLLKDVEVHEFREKQTEQYCEFFESHFKNTEHTKTYFKDITGRSLMLIDAIRNEISAIRQTGEDMKKTRQFLAQENEELSYLVKKARSCRIHKAHYEQDKTSNTFTRRRIKEYAVKVQELEKANEDLNRKFVEVTAAKEDLAVQFVSTLKIIQDGLNTKNHVAQAKVEDILGSLEEIGVNTASLRLPPEDNMECLELKI